MNTKRWLAIGIAVVLLLVSVGFRFTMNVASGLLNDVFELDEDFLSEEIIQDGDLDKRIAVLNLEGVIQSGEESLFGPVGYQHDDFINTIHKAGEDETIKAIILKIDSPGGAVGETADIHRALIEVKEEYDKPIYVSMGNTAASGGYYAAVAGDTIFAEPSTLTGSIGVIMESINYSGLAEKYGVEFNTIKSGKHKDIMSPSREMTEEERDILQSMIDEMYGDFVDVIVDGRGLSEKKVRELGDGRVYTGRQAAENDLVDEVGNFDDALAALQEEHGLESASVIGYGLDLGIFGNISMAVENLIQGKNEDVNMLSELVRRSDQPRAMYLY